MSSDLILAHETGNLLISSSMNHQNFEYPSELKFDQNDHFPSVDTNPHAEENEKVDESREFAQKNEGSCLNEEYE